MNQQIPIIHFETSAHHKHHKHMVCRDSEVYGIADELQLYDCLGFTKPISHKQVFDEYIWETFKRDQARLDANCLQTLYCSFLYKRSAEFRNRYGVQIEALAGTCTAAIRQPGTLCDNCKWMPLTSSKSKSE